MQEGVARELRKMSDLVVLDTNIFVSYLLPSKRISAVKIVVTEILKGKATPVFSDAIISEYNRVLRYKKFGFSQNKVQDLLDAVFEKGFCVSPDESDVSFVDKSDKCFYDAAVAASAKWLITGNKRHFPHEPFIVTAAEYLDLTKDV